MKRNFPIICCLIIGLIISGCGTGQLSGPTATPTPTPIMPASGTFSTNLLAEASPEYGLIFIIEPNETDKIAGYMVMCGNGGRLSMSLQGGFLGIDVEIKDGQFVIDNQDIFIQGKFTDATTLEGTMMSKPGSSVKCSIPQSAQWTATCGAPVGLSYLMISGKSFSEEILTGPCK